MSNIKWSFSMHVNAGEAHTIMYRNNELGIQREVTTPYKDGCPGKGEVSYYIDGDKRDFATERELVDTIKQKGMK